MEFFNKVAAVKLRSHLHKYLIADDDQESVRQSRNGATRKARWLVELVDTNSHVIRLKSCHGRYLTATDASVLLGVTGHKVAQTVPENLEMIEWEPIRDGFKFKLRANFGGTYLRANGGTLPWRNSVTHDGAVAGSSHDWILWDVEGVDVPEDESLNDYLTMVSSLSAVSDELSGLNDLGSQSPVTVQPPRFNFSHRFSMKMMKKKKMKNYIRPIFPSPAMDLFLNAKAVRLRSHHDKYLTADEDEESVTQDRNATSNSSHWTVEFLHDDSDNVIHLKSCYGKYLTASNQPFLLGMTGRKVLQTLPSRLDSSVEWEPIREGNNNYVKLRTRYGQFLRGNGGLPPWRNSVTHDIPHRTSTQDWILWEVEVVEIVDRSTKLTPLSVPQSDSFASSSESSSPTIQSAELLAKHESTDSLVYSQPKRGNGRTIYYQIADEFGNVEEGEGVQFITFKGNDVDGLSRRLEEETGLHDIIVCLRSQRNGNLYPLKLQLPPNNVTMNVVLVQSSSTVATDFI